MLCCVRQLCTDEFWFRFTFSFCALVYIDLAVCVFFWFSLRLFCSCVVCFCCVRFSFFSNTPRDWLGITSPKWSILRRVERETLTQCSLTFGVTKLPSLGYHPASIAWAHPFLYSTRVWHRQTDRQIDTSRQHTLRSAFAFKGVATGVYRYVYPPKISPWKLCCALIAADDVRLLVQRTAVLCSKNLYHPTTNFWLRPCLHSMCIAR